jgi:hypothetical protein
LGLVLAIGRELFLNHGLYATIEKQNVVSSLVSSLVDSEKDMCSKMLRVLEAPLVAEVGGRRSDGFPAIC